MSGPTKTCPGGPIRAHEGPYGPVWAHAPHETISEINPFFEKNKTCTNQPCINRPSVSTRLKDPIKGIILIEQLIKLTELMNLINQME